MLTAEENILLPLEIAGAQARPGLVSSELIAKVGLSERLSHRPSEMSGGQQQRVAVARALASRPTVMFADEPTGNLDSTTSGEILELMRDLVDGFGQTTVMVTHDPHAAAIADRVLFLADGEIVRDLDACDAHTVIDDDGRTEGLMRRVALKGLWWRAAARSLTASRSCSASRWSAARSSSPTPSTRRSTRSSRTPMPRRAR